MRAFPTILAVAATLLVAGTLVFAWRTAQRMDDLEAQLVRERLARVREQRASRADAPGTEASVLIARAQAQIAEAEASSARSAALSSRAYDRIARAELRLIALPIHRHQREQRRLPESLDAVIPFVDDRGGLVLQVVPKDPWGAAYVYRMLGPDTYDLRSHGPDGQPATADDIVHSAEK